MNKSTEFVINYLEQYMGEDVSSYNSKYYTMTELEPFTCLKDPMASYVHNNVIELGLLHPKQKDSSHKSNLKIVYNPDCKFQYLMAEDMPSKDTFGLLDEMMMKLIHLQSHNADTIPSDFTSYPWLYDVEYTIGNFVVMSLKNNSFIFLPVAIKYIKRDEQDGKD